jgi:feruloyl esterase
MSGRLIAALALAIGISTPSFAAAQGSCAIDSLPALPDIRVVSVSSETAPVPHCKVAGVIGTETNFELLLPDKWNGKFVMGGGGGFVGSVVNTALLFSPLQKGYATAGTDTGHQAHSLDGSWALNNLERIVSFGHQAVHRTTVTAKAIIAGFYGSDILRSYFTGCSRGGGQALMEAQRYPEDFDGIVAGAPANNWTIELGARNTRLNQAMFPDPNDLSLAVIGPEAQQLIGEAVLDQCDALDGLQDGILNDPMECDFDVSKLACGSAKMDACLSEEEVSAAQTVYSDLYIDGKRVFPGFPVGAELDPTGWRLWFTGGLDLTTDDIEFQEGARAASNFPEPVTPNAQYAFGNGVMKYLIYNDPDWSYVDYDFEDFLSASVRVASTLNATDPDLTAFRKRGGKLLIYNGWGDMALSPFGTIEYYESVLNHDSTAAEDVRLILKPGVMHCAGGPGPFVVDYLDVIDDWVETGKAPEQLIAFWINTDGQLAGSRPVCAYPTVVKYNGAGGPKEASSFTCE